MKPSRFGSRAGAASSGTTLTSGLPALAMMNGSPLAARSTSRDRWVLASWMLTVRIWSPQLDQVNLVYLLRWRNLSDAAGELALRLSRGQDRHGNRESK